jgi:hypothetical protein
MEGKSAFFIIREGVPKTQKDEQCGGVEVRTLFPDVFLLMKIHPGALGALLPEALTLIFCPQLINSGPF